MLRKRNQINPNLYRLALTELRLIPISAREKLSILLYCYSSGIFAHAFLFYLFSVQCVLFSSCSYPTGNHSECKLRGCFVQSEFAADSRVYREEGGRF